MRVNSLAELPQTYGCNLCGHEKPIAEMMLTRTGKTFMLRPRCKACHNARERGHRREYKRNYLRRWRKWHPELDESYWRERNQRCRAQLSARARERFRLNHAAILIQGRLHRRLGGTWRLDECRRLAKKFGPAYPTRFGLTETGRRECERIRSRMRAAGERVSPVELRMMVYEDGHYIKPSRQCIPYQHSANNLRGWREREQVAA